MENKYYIKINNIESYIGKKNSINIDIKKLKKFQEKYEFLEEKEYELLKNLELKIDSMSENINFINEES